MVQFVVDIAENVWVIWQKEADMLHFEEGIGNFDDAVWKLCLHVKKVSSQDFSAFAVHLDFYLVARLVEANVGGERCFVGYCHVPVDLEAQFSGQIEKQRHFSRNSFKLRGGE